MHDATAKYAGLFVACCLSCVAPFAVIAQESSGARLDRRVMGVWTWSSSFDAKCWSGSSFGHTVIDRKIGDGVYEGHYTPSVQTMQSKRADCAEGPAKLVSARVVYKVVSDNVVQISNDSGESGAFVWSGNTLRGKIGMQVSVGTKQ